MAKEHECEGMSPALHRVYGGEGRKRSPLCPSRQVVGRRTIPDVTRVREVALSLIISITRQSDIYTSTRQHSRAGLEDMRVGESDMPLAAYFIG